MAELPYQTRRGYGPAVVASEADATLCHAGIIASMAYDLYGHAMEAGIMPEGMATGLGDQELRVGSDRETGESPPLREFERRHDASEPIRNEGAWSTPAGRLRVLVADDHEMLRNVLMRLLREEADIEVVGVASNGAEALRLAHILQPGVVIMDVAMPGLNGIEATRRIKSELPRTHIIGFTMNSEPEGAAAMYAAGATACLSKSGTIEQLLAAVRGGAHPCFAHLPQTVGRHNPAIGSE